MKRRTFGQSGTGIAAVLLAWGVAAGQQQAAGLRGTWQEADHPSGVYHAKEAGRLTVVVENPTGDPLPLKGSVEFGMVSPPTAAGGEAVFKTLSVTPIAAATVGPGARVRLPIAVTFAAAGRYEVRWVTPEGSTPLENAAGVTLQCIFAPRTGVHADERWLTVLPSISARTPGYLTDLVAQTGVKKYLLDERFAFDAANNIGLAMGASLGVPAEQVDALLAEAAKGKAELVLRVAVPLNEDAADPRLLAAFHRYIEDAVKRGRGRIKAIVIAPEGGDRGFTELERRIYQAYYLAGYQAAKEADKGILMLGAGTAGASRALLLSDSTLKGYLDGIAVTDLAAQVGAAEGMTKAPVWVLPPLGWASGEAAGGGVWEKLSPAAALGEGAAIVALPPPEIDRGVAAHLLGGAVVYQKLHATGVGLPYCVAFQGDGYAVAAMAGLSAGTPVDAAYAQLAGSQTVVTGTEGDDTPPYAHWEVGDDTGSLRVVDAAGTPVDCRRGDTLYVPAADRVVYVLAGGSAEDLLSLLKAGMPGKLPVAMVEAARGEGDVVTVRVLNITEGDIGGTLRLLSPGSNSVLGEKKLVPVSAGKVVEVPLELASELPAGGVVVAEVTTEGTRGVVQRTLVRVGAAERRP